MHTPALVQLHSSSATAATPASTLPPEMRAAATHHANPRAPEGEDGAHVECDWIGGPPGEDGIHSFTARRRISWKMLKRWMTFIGYGCSVRTWCSSPPTPAKKPRGSLTISFMYE